MATDPRAGRLRLLRVRPDRRRRWRSGALLAAVLRAHPSQRCALRPAVGGRGARPVLERRRGWRPLHRVGRLVHGCGSRRRRCLPAQDDHPRLGRGDRAASILRNVRAGDAADGEGSCCWKWFCRNDPFVALRHHARPGDVGHSAGGKERPPSMQTCWRAPVSGCAPASGRRRDRVDRERARVDERSGSPSGRGPRSRTGSATRAPCASVRWSSSRAPPHPVMTSRHRPGKRCAA